MSFYKHPLDDIHVGDYVVLEVSNANVGEPDYTYQVSGEVHLYDGVHAVGRNGIGEGKIIEHRRRPLPTTFASHIRYPNSGVQWVKTTGDYWQADDGRRAEADELAPGWLLVRDAKVKP